MYSIGEFSKITRLTIKSLRLYHEKKILPPAMVDEFTSYRYYDDRNIETARVIVSLKQLGFGLDKIKAIMDGHQNEADIMNFLTHRRAELDSRIKEYTQALNTIDQIIQMETGTMTDIAFEIEEKTVDSILIAGFRMKGQYPDVGQGFKQIGKHFGRRIIGKPMTLYYDEGYVEDGADFEPCFPVRKGTDIDGIRVRRLEGCRCVSLIHQGPFERIGTAYRKLFAHINDNGYRTGLPHREVYLKSPGVIFKGNPNNYLTEILIPLKDGHAE